MHQNTVQVTSLRQDGTAFKCTLPEEGEVWMTIPDNMKGHVEWKATYNIGWTKNPRKTGGFFYNLKQLQVASAAPPAGHNNPPLSNGNGSPVPHSYKDLDIATQAVAKIFGPLIIAREVEGEITKEVMAEIMIRCEDGVKRWWRSRNKAVPTPAPPPVADDIEDTF